MIKRETILFIAVVAALVTMGCEKPARVRFPVELLPDENIYLGQSLSYVERDKVLDYDDSRFCYVQHGTGGLYFETVHYNCAVNTLFDRATRLRSIELESGDNGADSITELAAHYIVELLSRSFGADYVITDIDPHKPDSLRRPMLLWRTDSCAVMFIYTPMELYGRLLNHQKVVPSALLLTMSRVSSDVDVEPALSVIYTRRSLGIDKIK